MFKEPNNDLKIDVINVLEKVQANGWDIYKMPGNIYRIMITSDDFIEVRNRSNVYHCYVAALKSGKSLTFDKVTTTELLMSKIEKAAKVLNADINIDKPITSTRLKSTEPASNKSKLQALIGNSKIKAIFDPYFDTKALANLLSLWRLGVPIYTNVQILLSNSQKAKTFDKNFQNDFEIETKSKVEVKRCQSEREHRRFLLLDDESVVIIGCSLNDINKNEAVEKVLSDEDINFFVAEWNSGTFI